MDELGWLDATALAHLIHSGELSPLEAVDDAIARIEALNPKGWTRLKDHPGS